MSKISDEKIDEIARDYKAILLGENPYFPWFDFARAIEAAVLEAQPTDQRLINLLCRIHRDGGHYIAEHGLDKAVEDADMRVAEQNAVLDAQVKQEPVAWWCEGYFDDEEEAQNYCDTKAQIAESITPLFATTTNHRY